MRNLHYDYSRRLKFAYARGARIEQLVPTWRDQPDTEYWEQARIDLLESTPPDQMRVHPRDAHLLYGLFSQALIQSCVDSCPGELVDLPMAIEYARSLYMSAEERADTWHAFFEDLVESDEDQMILMFYLFAAEAMADEGL